jgi:hypothetical protein
MGAANFIEVLAFHLLRGEGPRRVAAGLKQCCSEAQDSRG